MQSPETGISSQSRDDLSADAQLLLATVERFSRLQWFAFCRDAGLEDTLELGEFLVLDRGDFSAEIAKSRFLTLPITRWVAVALDIVRGADGESLVHHGAPPKRRNAGSTLLAVEAANFQQVLRSSTLASRCFSFLGTTDANSIRSVSRACLEAVRAHPWSDSTVEIYDVYRWRNCLPLATAARVKLQHIWPTDFMQLTGLSSLVLVTPWKNVARHDDASRFAYYCARSIFPGFCWVGC
jgi:hypothetical protein